MLKRTRWLLLAGVVGTLSAQARLAQCDEPIWTRSSKPLVPVEAREVESQPTPMATAMPTPPDVYPPEVQGAGFRRYAPAPMVVDDAPPIQAKHKRIHAPIGGYLDRFTHWFFYRAPNSPHHCCLRPSQYRPPLYAWYPYVPANFANRGGCVVVVVQQQPPTPTVMATIPGAAPFVNERLPVPQMPKNVGMERPFLPGSSTIMADNPDPVNMPASLIKSSAKVPVMEPPTSGYNPIPLPGYLPANLLPKK